QPDAPARDEGLASYCRIKGRIVRAAHGAYARSKRFVGPLTPRVRSVRGSDEQQRIKLRMNLIDKFQHGLAYADFLARYANEGQKQRWQQMDEQVVLTSAQGALLGTFRRTMNALCLAGAWCGDCINQCPIFE